MSSSINTLLSNSYYQLSNPSAEPGGTSQPNPADALAQALSSSPDSAPSSSDAYLLDLSPQAQQYLNSSGAASSVTATGSSTASFTLSPQQQQAITSILEKYADAPQTQATFDSIQNDLNAAGLGASQLSQEDQAKNFNPTQLLVDDLNGDYSDANTIASGNSSAEQTKSANYMQQIISQWENLSGISSSQISSDAVTAAAGTGGA